MPSSDPASQKSPLSIARAALGGNRPRCDVARGAGSDGLPMEATLSAIDKYDNRVVPFSIAAGAAGIGRRIHLRKATSTTLLNLQGARQG
jgi:hypothetical protein